ncbi:MAG: hypothetical protein MJE68_08490, partial [Proteobacteria bacterium]|nr:hypothetical protein [Pseudomonadota bacterium]
LFYGMTQHLHDSMRYLYKRPETNYDELLLTAKEAECEWTEQKSLKSKATVTKITKDERDDIKQRLDKLAETVKAASFEKRIPNYKKKNMESPVSSPQTSPRKSPRNPGRGPDITAAGPFHGDCRPIQCWKCGGWGHVIRECPTQGNINWRELRRAGSPPAKTDPGPESTSSNNQ